MLTGLDKCIKELNKNKEISIAIFKNNKVITSKYFGIKPLMTYLREDRNYFKGADVADKIIGKAAAMLLIYGGAGKIYGKVMSASAAEILEKYDMDFYYETKVAYIKNREGTGKCPMEIATENVNDPELSFDVLEQTIKELMKSSN